jgi:streptogramin lyase
MDGSGNLWIPVVQANKIVKFDVAGEQFTAYDIPTTGSTPVGISVDRQGNVWFAEAAGRIGKVDPATGKITEYAPPSERNALDEPTAVFPDPRSSTIYISEHGGHTITAFNPMLGIFRKYPSVNEGGLPFGMAMDSYGNLWYAQHEIDRVAVIDPRTGAGAEAKVPITGSFIQWITSDDRGRIWFAAQRGASLGSITITAKPVAPQEPVDGSQQGGSSGNTSQVPQLPFSLADLAGPAIAAGIALSALAYSKSAIDLKRNMRTALKLRT